MSERFAESVAAAESALAISGRHPWAMAALAQGLGGWGKRADAKAVYGELMCRARRSYVPPSTLTLTALAAGMHPVFVGSKPFDAWRAFRGGDGMPPTDQAIVGGKLRAIVWMPSLYPPRHLIREPDEGWGA